MPSSVRRPSGTGSEGSAAAHGATPAGVLAPGGARAQARVIVSHLTAASEADREAALRDDGVSAFTENVNGAQCSLESTPDGNRRAFNRRGQPSASVPDGALVLAAAPMPRRPCRVSSMASAGTATWRAYLLSGDVLSRLRGA
jgi:hypothetical protein